VWSSGIVSVCGVIGREIESRQGNERSIFKYSKVNQLFSLRDTAMLLRSQRPLHVQGVAGHPGQQGGGPKKNIRPKWSFLKSILGTWNL
jgi:hypothetical protein